MASRIRSSQIPRLGSGLPLRGLEGRLVPAETHTQRVPLDRASVVELVRDRLAEILELDAVGRSTETDRSSTTSGSTPSCMIELVESLEDELGERTVGFHIDDEDLEDLETVRDAVDDVVSPPWLSQPRPSELEALDADRLGHAFADPDAARSRRSGTGRGAPRTAASSPTSASSSWATPCWAWSSPTTCTAPSPTCPRACWPNVGPSWSTPASLAELARRDRPGLGHPARSGRGATGGRRQGLDPRRRHRGGLRRGVPRRRLSTAASAVILDLLDPNCDVVGRAAGDRLQVAPAGARRPTSGSGPGLRVEGDGPGPRPVVRGHGGRRWPTRSGRGEGAIEEAGRTSRRRRGIGAARRGSWGRPSPTTATIDERSRRWLSCPSSRSCGATSTRT